MHVIGRRSSPLLLVLVGAMVVACAGPSADVTPGTSAPIATPSASAPPAPSAARDPSAPVPSEPTVPQPVMLDLEPVLSGLAEPLDLAVRPGDPAALFIVEQVGRIRVARDGALADDPVLDISGIVTAGGEQGLLGLAFHPVPTDPRLFVYYTGLGGEQVVASYRMDAARPDRARRDSERILLRMPDRFSNHNGGALAFGPDGYLYISTGDGGGGGDPLGSGRDLDTLLAKILRIDVGPDDAGPDPYAVPADNPFVDVAGARPEIWATGLRNPWRMRFDRATGDLWIGDVGQGSWEEINVAPSGVGGLDFGWNLMEGFHCYPSGQDDGCVTPDLRLPVAAYGHDQGCSVTGGAVYRGTAQPTLAGWYVFADYCSGRMWLLDAAAGTRGERPDPVVALDSGRNISAIAEDAAGELYVTDIDRGDVLRLVVAGG